MGNRKTGKVWEYHKKKVTTMEALLIVCIGVILAGMICPFLLRAANDKSNEEICMSNLKQIGLAFMMYANDYDDWFPTATPDTPLPYGSWCYMLSPYLGIKWPASQKYYPESGPAVFYCPSAKEGVSDIYPNSIPSKNKLYYLSYGYNRTLYEFKPDATDSPTIKRGQITRPAKFLLAADYEVISSLGKGYTDGSNYSSAVGTGVGWYNSFGYWHTDEYAYRHNNMINVLFADGSVGSRNSRVDGRPHDFYLAEKGTKAEYYK